MTGKRDDEAKHSPFETPREDHENRDPITGTPGAHPVGAGIGAAGGASMGAAIGAAAGPLGAVAGAAIGGVAGGLVGKGVAEGVNPTVEHDFWRERFHTRPYYQEGLDYETYGSAYQYGWESRSRYAGRSFQEIEDNLRRDWDVRRGERDLEWEAARPAIQDAWDRMDPRGGKTV